MSDEEQIRQCMSFRWVKGRGQQQASKKDDILMASSIAWSVHLVTPEEYLDDFDAAEFRKSQEKWRFK